MEIDTKKPSQSNQTVWKIQPVFNMKMAKSFPQWGVELIAS